MLELVPGSENSSTLTNDNSGNTYGSQYIGGNARVINGDIHIYNKPEPPTAVQKFRTDVLNWLSPLTFRSFHEEVRNKAVHQDTTVHARNSGNYSGKWLLESDVFEEWRSREARKLWYHGMPGAGKTVLASVVIDHMIQLSRSLPETDSFKVAYLYLSYKQQHSLVQLLGSIVRQLVQDDAQLPDLVLKEYNQHKNRGNEAPTQQELSIMLASLVTQRPLYIVIDGLDECPRETRRPLVKLLQPDSFQSLKLNIMITSRLLDEFETLAKGFERIDIKADAQDLNLFIDSKFDEDAYLSGFAEQDPKLQQDVKEAIQKAWDGMFLLATIHVNLIASKLTLAAIRQCLRELPTDIDMTYELAMHRILSQREEIKKLALYIFVWILNSHGPMKLAELQHALAINPVTRSFDPEYIHQESRIRDVCGGLITVTKDSVKFVHYTAQAYFTSHVSDYLKDAHALIAETCASYLCLPALEQPDDTEQQMSFADDLYEDTQADSTTLQIHQRYTNTRRQSAASNSLSRTPSPASRVKLPRLTFNTKLERFPLVEFAARHLGHHLRVAKEEDARDRLILVLKKLIQNRGKRNFLLRMWHRVNMFEAKYEQRITDLDLYASNASGSIAAGLLESGLAGRRSMHLALATGSSDWLTANKEVTPMHIAAFLGWLPLVSALIAEKCEFEVLDPDGRSPFIIAVQEGRQDIATALLEAGATCNLASSVGQDVMLQVAQDGHLDVVTMTLSHILRRFEAEAEDAGGQDLTKQEASQYWLIQMLLYLVWMLLNYRQEEPLMTPITPGARVEKLPGEIRKAILSLVDDNLQLLAAAGFGEAEIIQDLLQKEYSGDTEPYSKHTLKTALFLAVESGFVSAAEALLANGTDINSADPRGNTVLHRAALRNDLRMVEMILAYNPEINATNKAKRSAWSLINEGIQTRDFRDRRQVLDALVAAGVDPNARDNQGVGVLYGAAAGGHTEVVRYLLDVGVDPGSQTVFGWAPLHWAAADGHFEVVRMLVEAGANLDPLSDTSRTPLDLARTHKDNPNRAVTVQFLEEAGAKSAQEVLAARATRRIAGNGSVETPFRSVRILPRTNTFAAAGLSDAGESYDNEEREMDSDDVAETSDAADEDHHDTVWQHVGDACSDEARSEEAVDEQSI